MEGRGQFNNTSTMTEEDLKSLAGFGKEEDGSYCDRWEFSIINTKYDGWCLFFFCEVDGSTHFIKRLEDLDDLKNIYHAITNEVLEIKLTPREKWNRRFNVDYFYEGIEFEFEIFFQSDNAIQKSGWYPITSDKIKNIDKIHEYLEKGMLRKKPL